MVVFGSATSTSLQDTIEAYESALRDVHHLHSLVSLPSPQKSVESSIRRMKDTAEVEQKLSRAQIVFLRDATKLIASSQDLEALKKVQTILTKRTSKQTYVFDKEKFAALNPDKTRQMLEAKIARVEKQHLKKSAEEALREIQKKCDVKEVENGLQQIKVAFALTNYADTGSLEDAKAIVQEDATLDLDLASLRDEVIPGSFAEFKAERAKYLTKAKAHVRIDELLSKALNIASSSRYYTKEVLKELETSIEVVSRFERYASIETKEQDDKIRASLNDKLQKIIQAVEALKQIEEKSKGAARGESPVRLETLSEAQLVITLAEQITSPHTTWDQEIKYPCRDYIVSYLEEEINLRKKALEQDPDNLLLQKRLSHVIDVKYKVEAFDQRAKTLASSYANHSIHANFPIPIFVN